MHAQAILILALVTPYLTSARQSSFLVAAYADHEGGVNQLKRGECDSIRVHDDMLIYADIDQLGLSKEEVKDVFGDLCRHRDAPSHSRGATTDAFASAILHSTRHSDCHTTIASRLQASCSRGGSGEEGLDEAERSGSELTSADLKLAKDNRPSIQSRYPSRSARCTQPSNQSLRNAIHGPRPSHLDRKLRRSLGDGCGDGRIREKG